ncbi:hypothetical protein GCM10023185_29120 [Hymenobacter saemangeumensis]|uniref:Uncharacterized protein n=1 Tax=Hymenobacter saemangeumensis TaxID=1084522 RepID=A0ABP8IKV1_9BACT
MNTYDQEVFNYLTQVENYRSAKQVASQLSQIDNKLRTDFWNEVRENITTKLNSLNAGPWKVDLTLQGSGGLKAYQPEWEDFGINLDLLSSRPDFGIYCPLTAYDREKVNTLIVPIILAERMTSKTNYWPCYRAISFDFSQQSTLESILPARRGETIDAIAGLFEEFVNKYLSVLENIAREAKIGKTDS